MPATTIPPPKRRSVASGNCEIVKIILRQARGNSIGPSPSSTRTKPNASQIVAFMPYPKKEGARANTDPRSLS